VWKKLLAQGIRVSKDRVQRLMKLHGIKARTKRRFKATTDSRHNLPVAPNLLQRDFSPAKPDQVWTTDITYLWTDEGWLYLTVILDLFSRQVVGWSLKPHMRTELVSDALRMARFRRRPETGLIVHSDRGSQYCSAEFQDLLKSYGMQSSMSRRANCWDKACVSHYTSLRRSETTSGWRRRQDSLTPIAFLGESVPGGSYRHSFLSL